MGGLIGNMNNYVENFDPVRGASSQSRYWRNVYEHTGMSYPVQLEWMYRSTEPGGKAVKAAELQSESAAQAVLRRLRESTFVFGRPADNAERIIDACKGIPGLDSKRFRDDLTSDVVTKAFREDWEETRRPNDYVMTLEGDRPGIGRAKHTEGHWRFVFPTVIFRSQDGEATVPGWCPYEEYEAAMKAVAPGSTRTARSHLTTDEYFVAWPTATEKELAAVCGEGAKPPDGIVSFYWGEGRFFLTPDEASSWGVA